MNDKKFIFVLDGSAYRPMYEKMVHDVQFENNVSIVVDVPNHGWLKKLLLKRKIQRISKGCLDFLGMERNNLYSELKKLSNDNTEIIVVFFNGSLLFNPYLAGTLARYKEEFHTVHFVLFYLDLIGAGVSANADYLREHSIFDIVYTVDQQDAIQYNINLWNTIYSIDNQTTPPEVDKMLYFCGVEKGRDVLLKDIFQCCQKNGIKCRFDLIASDYETQLHQMANSTSQIAYLDHYLKYDEVLLRELQSNCILEIVQKGQTALTLRPYEAVIYNKKLLTNNKTILGFKYYDPRYMRYFATIEDIDWEWVREDVDTNYNYSGDFSPVLLLDELRRYSFK